MRESVAPPAPAASVVVLAFPEFAARASDAGVCAWPACAPLIIVAQIIQPPARVAIAAGNNVLLQSMENYRAVLAGNITPQVASSDPASVRKLFEGATTFPVHVPRLRHCTLIGGVAERL